MSAAVGLLVSVLVRPRDPRLALWHVVGCVLIVMPTSHIVYLTLLVPIAWCRLAHALDRGRGPADVVMVIVTTAWWVAAMRPWSPESLDGYVLTTLATVAMLVTSVLVDWRRQGRAVGGDVRGAASSRMWLDILTSR